MTMRADADHPLSDAIAERWSPYGFADRPIPRADLAALFEAARWAPSAYNEQPWSFIVALREDGAEFARMLDCLVEANRVWAQFAGALALGITHLNFRRNEKPNRTARHDLGLATGNLLSEATARGIAVHIMAGIDQVRAREVYAIPTGHEPVTGIALGFPGQPEGLPEAVARRDAQRRPRHCTAEFLFGGQWGSSSGLLDLDR